MSAVDRLAYDSDPDGPAEATAADKPSPKPVLHVVADTRTPGEAQADLRQSADSGWDRQKRFEVPREELARFKPERAGLPEVSLEDADRYLAEHSTDRPWLKVAERAAPESRRILVAVDLGGGHGHIRHDGWVTEEANMRRAAFLEDPAQLDPEKRTRGIDGIKADDKRHKCGYLVSRITDPDAYATAFARGTEHPAVRAVLDTPYDPDALPDPVRLPIADLLGQDGHKFCTGWHLEPVAESMETARVNRLARRSALAEGRKPEVPEPSARPVATFEGGEITFLIGHNETRTGYEMVTIYPRPTREQLIS